MGHWSKGLMGVVSNNIVCVFLYSYFDILWILFVCVYMIVVHPQWSHCTSLNILIFHYVHWQPIQEYFFISLYCLSWYGQLLSANLQAKSNSTPSLPSTPSTAGSAWGTGRKRTRSNLDSDSHAKRRRSVTNSTAKQAGDKQQGKGLRHFSQRVCEKVREKGTTSYNEVCKSLS